LRFIKLEGVAGNKRENAGVMGETRGQMVGNSVVGKKSTAGKKGKGPLSVE